MLRVQESTLVVGILAKIQSLITERLPRGTYDIPSTDTLMALAKDLGFIEGGRGRAGNKPSDAGLRFINRNVEDYRAKEALDKMHVQQERLEQAKRDREERAQALQQSLQTVLASSKNLEV